MTLAAVRLWRLMDKAGRIEAIKVARLAGYGVEDIAVAAGIKQDNRLLVETVAALAPAPCRESEPASPAPVPEPGDRVGHAVSVPDVPVGPPARSADRDPPIPPPLPPLCGNEETQAPEPVEVSAAAEEPDPGEDDDDTPDMVEVGPHRYVQRKIARRLGILGASA